MMFWKIFFLLTVLAFSGFTRAADRCEELLSGNTYSCQISTETGTNAVIPFEFVEPMDGSVLGDMQLNVQGAFVFSCNCATSGKPHDPDKGKEAKLKPSIKSRNFTCLETLDTQSAVIYGEVSGNGDKLKGFYMLNSPGSTGVFRCVNAGI